MISGVLRAALIGALLAIAPAAHAAPPAQAAPSAQPAALSTEMDAYMKAAVRHAQFSGTVLVARDGAAIFTASYGMANYELSAPNTPQTAFQIGSLSKQFTAAAILQLRDKGKLDLDDPACRHLESCPTAWTGITIRHLLNHTSGIPNFSSLPGWDERLAMLDYPHGSLVALFRDLPLTAAPGSTFKYSNSGYYLLGRIIERLSGKSFGDYLEDEIFTPLGMIHSRYEEGRLLIPNRAAGYYSAGSSFIGARRVSPTVQLGGSGIWSTVGDLLIWDRALAAGRVVSPASMAEMFTPGLGSYGYGWRIGEKHGRPVVDHSGSDNGFSSYIIRFPRDQVTVIVLSNSDRASAGRVGQDLSAMVFGAPYVPAKAQLRDLLWDRIEADGPAAGIALYQHLQRADSKAHDFTDEPLVELGYDLIEARRFAAAEAVFRFSLKTFPRSAYSYDGLADIAMARGDVAAAAAHFERSLAIDPENGYAVEGLERLRQATAVR